MVRPSNPAAGPSRNAAPNGVKTLTPSVGVADVRLHDLSMSLLTVSADGATIILCRQSRSGT